MLFKVKDYITWGNVDDNTVKELVEKRGAVLESDKRDWNSTERNIKDILSSIPLRKDSARKG